MLIRELDKFCLVGGTALSLRYGHRISVDLDLFGAMEDFQPEILIDALIHEFGVSFIYDGGGSKWAIFCYIDQIKIDIVNFPHPLIRPIEIIDDIRFLSNEDISAMKINAILGRGKKKDFWDIVELLDHYPLSDIIDFHRQKYPKQMLLISIPQALTYFLDAEESEEPLGLKGQTWEGVKSTIQNKVKSYLM